jgi:signal transduction histidine kinase
MTNSAPPSRLLSDRRLFPVIGIVPYVVLAAATVLTVVVRRGETTTLLIDLGLCALAAAWMLGMFSIPKAWRSRPRIMAVFVIGIILLLAAMVLREAWFGLFSIAGFLYVFGLLRWPWRLAGVAAVAAIAGGAQGSGLPTDTTLGRVAFVAIVLVNVAVMCGYCWIQWTSDELGVERTRALGEAKAANLRLESSLAENAALQDQLLTRARQAGVLDERQRMAREIHDTLAQGLIGIITQLEAAELADSDPARRRRHFEAASTLARESLSEARRSVSALRPEPLEAARLSDALAEVAQRWSVREGIPVWVTTTGSVEPIASEAEVALLRAAQEALANVAKHSGADRVGVTLSYLADEVALDVRDDGAGFDPDAHGSTGTGEGGFGLIALRERVEQLSGSVRIESEPGRGTAVSVRVPVTTTGVSA